MAKIDTLDTITTGYLSNEQINSNFTKVTTALSNTVSRDGSSPNTLTADLDMNSQQLINLATPTTDYNASTKKYVDDNTNAASLAAAAASAAAALVSENNAATSETNAATSETNAATSETNAATSETNAAASAAGVNLPSITATDTGSILQVNAAGTAHELLTAGTSGYFLKSNGADTALSWDQAGSTKLLETQTASSSSSIEFTSNIDSTYDKYILEFMKVRTSTSAQILLTTSDDGGSTYGTDYDFHRSVLGNGSTSYSGVVGSGSTSIGLTDTINSTGLPDVSGRIIFTTPSTSRNQHFRAEVEYSKISNDAVISNVACYTTALTFDAIKLAPSTGTFTVGTFKLYGIS